MKRDRKKGSRPEYEDLLYDETPSVVVYYPSRGSDEDAPEPTVKRDRSKAFVPDLAELEPLTREQPVIEAEESGVTPLFPGRAEPVVDPAKPVPTSLQSRGLLAWDPTHRDPGEEDSLDSFFRPQPESQPPAARNGSSGQDRPAPLAAPQAAPPPPAAGEVSRPGSSLRPVVFETDIIAADFIEADAIRADPPAATVRRTIIEEVPPSDEVDDLYELDEDDSDDPPEAVADEAPGFIAGPALVADRAPASEGFGRPVDVAPVVIAPVSEVVDVEVAEPAVAVVAQEVRTARPVAAPEESSPSWLDSDHSRPLIPEADYSSIDRDGPDTSMRFLQEWEAEVTGSHEAQVANHTGRLFRSLRAHPQPQTLPALRRDQAARFKSLNSTQDSGPVSRPVSPAAPAFVALDEDLASPVAQFAPPESMDAARIWTASSMSGMKPGLVYLIPLVATVLVGLVNAIFLGPGIGWPTGVALLISSVVCALRVRLVDASVAVIAPPLAFLAAAAIAGQIGMSMAGGPVIGAASNLFLALSGNVLWLVGATLASLLVVVIRTRRDRA
jgi:hypothetical protein